LLRVAAFLGKFLIGTALALAVILARHLFPHARGAASYSGHRSTCIGLKAPVEILRDKNAVPHIIAGSLEDASFALGYVHAQDRFWQMELMRRARPGTARGTRAATPSSAAAWSRPTAPCAAWASTAKRFRERECPLARHARDGSRRTPRASMPGLRMRDQQYGLELTADQASVRWPLPARAMAAGRFAGLGQAHGVWPRRQLAGRALRLRLSQKIGEDGVKFLIEPSGDSKRLDPVDRVMAAVKDIDLDRIYPRAPTTR
jgi:penicillin amidase